MRLIQGNILGTLVGKEDNLIKKGSLFLLGDTKEIKFDKVVIKDYDRDNLEPIKIGAEAYIHRGSGNYLNKEDVIFHKSDVIQIK